MGIIKAQNTEKNVFQNIHMGVAEVYICPEVSIMTSVEGSWKLVGQNDGLNSLSD